MKEYKYTKEEISELTKEINDERNREHIQEDGGSEEE